jgi:hypothetical protein
LALGAWRLAKALNLYWIFVRRFSYGIERAFDGCCLDGLRWTSNFNACARSGWRGPILLEGCFDA